MQAVRHDDDDDDDDDYYNVAVQHIIQRGLSLLLKRSLVYLYESVMFACTFALLELVLLIKIQSTNG